MGDIFAIIIAFLTNNWVDILGYMSTVFSVAGALMSTMIPLRIAAILNSIVAIIYALYTGAYPILVTELILLPINSYRLYEMMQLIKKSRAAATGGLSMDWLLPFATSRRFKAGDVLFNQGDEASEMLLAQTGMFRLRQSGIDVPPGRVVGELGFVAPDNRRTQTLECVEDGEMMVISYDDLRQLYFQNPQFGLYLLRLISERLFRNVADAEARAKAALEVAPVKLAQPG